MNNKEVREETSEQKPEETQEAEEIIKEKFGIKSKKNLRNIITICMY